MKEDGGIPVKDISTRKVNEQNLISGVVCLTHERLFEKGQMGRQVGPAMQRYDEDENVTCNIIRALHLPSLPNNLLFDWTERVANKAWPDAYLRRKIMQSGCELIPEGHGMSKSPQVEFRFSLTLAERWLMFDLNITQIRCLVLMKILIKTFIGSQTEFPDVVTSYFCKTALWYVIEDSGNVDWDHDHLLPYTMKCLQWLVRSLDDNMLPNYFIPKHDLLEGQLDKETRSLVVRILSGIISRPQDSLSQLATDDIGPRFLHKNSQVIRQVLKPVGEIKYAILNQAIGYHMFKFLLKLNALVYVELRQGDSDYNINKVKEYIALCDRFEGKGEEEMRFAVGLIKPVLYTTLGCLLGAKSTSGSSKAVLEALKWLQIGTESDLTSGRLKLASAFYSKAEYKRAEEILAEIETEYSGDYVMKVCGCRPNIRFQMRRGFYDGAIYHLDGHAVHTQCAYCVIFTRSEKSCVPIEFQKEMYRSTPKEVKRRQQKDYWMDWACVDAFPFLHFLQYLTYRALDDRKRSDRALHILHELVEAEDWYHKETIWNLLGQCYETKGDSEKAMLCYRRSTDILPTNNAANALKRKLKTK